MHDTKKFSCNCYGKGFIYTDVIKFISRYTLVEQMCHKFLLVVSYTKKTLAGRIISRSILYMLISLNIQEVQYTSPIYNSIYIQNDYIVVL